MPWYISRCLPFLTPAGDMRGFLSDIYSEKLVALWRQNSHTHVGSSSHDWVPVELLISHSCLSWTSSNASICISDFPTLMLAPEGSSVPVVCDSLCLPVCPSSLGGNDMPYGFTFPSWSLRYIFQFA